MSQHPTTADSPRLRDLVEEAWSGRLVNVTANGQPEGTVAYVFEPDLSAEEATTLGDLVALSRGGLTITPAEFVALKPTLVGLRDYHALASPTAAQTTAAVKGLIRVLRALLRD